MRSIARDEAIEFARGMLDSGRRAIALVSARARFARRHDRFRERPSSISGNATIDLAQSLARPRDLAPARASPLVRLDRSSGGA
jgi:hypothetical protein